MVLAAAAALAAAVAGCGTAEPPSAEEVARAWARAVDERDWERACELSTPVPDDCPRALARSFGDFKEPRVKRVIRDEGSLRFELSTAGTDPPYQILLEPHDGSYLVHLEVAVIR